jgi:hypothetical protein
MNTLVASILKHEAAEASAAADPFRTVMLFCGVGLVATLCVMSFGFDVGAAFF